MIVLFLVCALLCAHIRAIEVTNTSSCGPQCGGGLTYSTDVICEDTLYDESETGQRMKNCLLCESTSTNYINSTENDIYWFLFNQKYTIQYCLFQEGVENTTAMPGCESDCLPLRPIFLNTWFKDDGGNIPLYDYCDMSNGAFDTYVEECESCIRGHSGSVVIANFLANMQSACDMKPNATDQEVVNLPQPLFSTERASATTTAPATTSTSASPDDSEPSGLSTGASVGIGVGVGGGVVIILGALIWFYYRRKRSRKTQTTPKRESIQKDDLEEQSPNKRLASVPLMEADNTPVPPAEADASTGDEGRTKAGGAWRAELAAPDWQGQTAEDSSRR